MNIIMPFEDIKYVLGTITSLCQIIQFFSGVLECRKFMRKGSSDEISSFPFICGFLSCLLWAGYSKLLDDSILVYMNILGAFLMFAYSSAYYIYSSRKARIIKFVIGVIFILIVTHVDISSLTEIEDKKRHLGIICSILTIAFFVAPLANLAQVFRQRSSDSLPFPIIVTSFIVSAEWVLYGYVIGDGFIKYLNLAGVILSFSQLTLFYIFPTRWMKTHKNDITVLIPDHRIKITS